MSVLGDEGIRDLLRQAWEESSPGSATAHEEGGFVLKAADGSLTGERWPKGLQNEIGVPPHPGGKWNGLVIVATFHTHPNTGPDYLQGPSPTDVLAVRHDPELGHAEYEGEYVISAAAVYLVRRDGTVQNVGPTETVLGSAGSPKRSETGGP
jgi:hypothetical protein